MLLIAGMTNCLKETLKKINLRFEAMINTVQKYCAVSLSGKEHFVFRFLVDEHNIKNFLCAFTQTS
jgi:hypothetical protein